MIVKSRGFSGMFLALFLILSAASGSAFGAVSSYAGDDSLRDSIVKAVSTHPEVQSKWHAFRAAEYEIEAAKGGYRPRVDVTAGWGRDSLDGKGYSSSELFHYTRTGVAAFITQAIYDGN
ncbi:TolC family protein, partial [Synergistaceae bacterium OttesenSCG-928-I11]|nr:TolC family protein [Synergistaceae bacterium OttesenSCG-928-I11]